LNNKVGVMQGRLLPKYKGRYQAHPVGYWEQEFELAQSIGLDCIEFILDFNDAQKNPLLKKNGVNEILSLTDKTGVSVKTVCADYFMKAPLHSEDEGVVEQSQRILKVLLKNASSLGVSDIVIPCVDQSSLKGEAAKQRFVKSLLPLIDGTERMAVNLSLETDLSPRDFKNLLDRFDSNRITVNYDIGNSAALGYDPVEELDAYGHLITDIHIKDRMLGGGSLILGDGNADFGLFFEKMKSFNYRGPFIMQPYRDDEGIEVFKKQLVWITPYIENYWQ
jgi:L-ribulose-5-phosphate 3-epimerase